MTARLFSGIVATALLAPAVSLAEFVYTGVELAYVDVEFNQGIVDLNGDGFRFRGAYELNDKFFLQGEWEEQSFDFGIDGTSIQLGGGYRHAIMPTLDFVATASYVDAEVDVGPFGADDNGIELGGGIRTMIGNSFQLDAMLNWVNMDEGGSDTGIEVRGRYYFNNRWAIMLETDLDDDFDSLALGFRAEF